MLRVSVSLKTNLNIMDLHRLVGDVRRRVEHEITFEGTERRIKFVLVILSFVPLTNISWYSASFQLSFRQHLKWFSTS